MIVIIEVIVMLSMRLIIIFLVNYLTSNILLEIEYNDKDCNHLRETVFVIHEFFLFYLTCYHCG